VNKVGAILAGVASAAVLLLAAAGAFLLLAPRDALSKPAPWVSLALLGIGLVGMGVSGGLFIDEGTRRGRKIPSIVAMGVICFLVVIGAALVLMVSATHTGAGIWVSLLGIAVLGGLLVGVVWIPAYVQAADDSGGARTATPDEEAFGQKMQPLVDKAKAEIAAIPSFGSWRFSDGVRRVLENCERSARGTASAQRAEADDEICATLEMLIEEMSKFEPASPGNAGGRLDGLDGNTDAIPVLVAKLDHLFSRRSEQLVLTK